SHIGVLQHAARGHRQGRRAIRSSGRRHRRGADRPDPEPAVMSEAVEAREFEALLEYLKRTRGFDFSAYKRPSLTRRIQKRLQTVGCDRFADYTDYLEVHPEEFAELFNVILINVTA